MEKLTISCISVILLIGCNSMSKINEIKNERGEHLANHVSYDATRRGALIFEKSKNLVMVSEPPPDVATKLATELGAKVNAVSKVEVETYLQTTKAIAELGKRTSAVNILRDALYKLSEINMSKEFDKETTKILFSQILNVAQKISEVELTQAKVEEKNAEARTIEAKTENAKANNKLNDFETANRLESEGYELILDSKFEEARKKFEEVDRIYPQYHSAYELKNLLKNSINKNDSVETIVKKIMEVGSYNYSMPLKFRKQFNNILNKNNENPR